jgi:hypothetical protein
MNAQYRLKLIAKSSQNNKAWCMWMEAQNEWAIKQRG